jgi:hypothetical protein
VDITVPPDWQAAIVTQDSNTDTIYTFTSGSDNIARAHVIPNDGLLILNKASIFLPVELTSFTAIVTSKSVNLKWFTSTEINNNQFIIERMLENKMWENIGKLPGAGNSNSPKAYSFIDNSLNSKGKYSYRLKIIDNDGNYKYSNTVNVEVNIIPGDFSLGQNYPNPFNPSTKINYELSSRQNITVRVYDVLGNEIVKLVDEEKPAGIYELTWNAVNVPSGVYYYRMQAGSFVETKKMVLVK